LHLRFFRTGPGEYGEGDEFLGLKVPQIRKLARDFRALPLSEVEGLLKSKWHEARLLALVILVDQFERADEKVRDAIFRLYLRSTKFINNWDLVDTSAPYIVGKHLLTRPRKILYRLAKSKNLWERRIAIVSTQTFIRAGEIEDTFAIAKILLTDERDIRNNKRHGRTKTSQHKGTSQLDTADRFKKSGAFWPSHMCVERVTQH